MLLLCAVSTGLEVIASQVIYDSLLSSELLESRTGSAVFTIAGTDIARKDDRLFQLRIRAIISQFTFRLMWNHGPTQRVMRADRIHAEADHVGSIATESERSICIQLNNPSCGDLAKNVG